MKIVDWHIVCKTAGKQLNLVFLFGAIATMDYFIADALEKLGFSILVAAIFKGISVFMSIYHLIYAVILTKKIVERFY